MFGNAIQNFDWTAGVTAISITIILGVVGISVLLGAFAWSTEGDKY